MLNVEMFAVIPLIRYAKTNIFSQETGELRKSPPGTSPASARSETLLNQVEIDPLRRRAAKLTDLGLSSANPDADR